MKVYTVALRYVRDGHNIVDHIPILAVNVWDAQCHADELLQEYGGTSVHIWEIGIERPYSRTVLHKDWQENF